MRQEEKQRLLAIGVLPSPAILVCLEPGSGYVESYPGSNKDDQDRNKANPVAKGEAAVSLS